MVNTRRIENLVQGVSQQAAQQRRDTQHEAQYDCFNSPKDGCVSRNGFEFISKIAGNRAGAFFYEIFRGVDEHYLAMIHEGDIKVFNLEDGTECTVTDVSGAAYRTLGSGLDKDNWVGQTVDDFTFLANRTIKPAMATTLSPLRPREAMVFFKGSAYTCKYSINLHYAGSRYRWSYTTPDNTSAPNSQYIGTAYLAATFYVAMTGLSADFNSGPGVGALSGGGVGGEGDGTGTVAVREILGSLPAGFNVEVNGNLLRIWRTDNNDFQITVADDQGNQLIDAFKDNARSFNDLPKAGFEGFLLKVRGNKSDVSDDYYVAYTSTSSSDGFWQEVVAPGTPTSLDATTMPHGLVNTGPNTFEWRRLDWSTRIAGDEDTAKTPRFVGREIKDLFYNKKRFGILTEGSCEWSKSQNPYTFFPDTVQTVLATAPISIDLSAGGAIALARKTVEVDEALYVWAQGIQFRVDSGQNTTFRQESVEAPASTFYEFAEQANFGRIGSTLYFATEPGEWATLRQLVFQNTRPAGDVDVTAHVSEFIPSGIRRLSTSDTLRCLSVQTDGASNELYLYNYLLQDRNIVQSAWNPWRLPQGTILWSSIYRSDMYVALQRPDGVHLLKCSLRASEVDPGGTYHTAADLRVDESRCTVTYDPVALSTTVTLPYELAEATGAIRVVCRTTSGEIIRGQHFKVLSKPSLTSLKVEGNLVGVEFYVGLAKRSEALLTEFFLRDDNGLVDCDSLTVTGIKVYHAKTTYYRIEVDIGAGRLFTYELPQQPLDTYETVLNVPPSPRNGNLSGSVNAPSNKAKIRIVNDSVFPSRWQSAVFSYEAVITRRPTK